MPPSNVRINKENDHNKIITQPSSPDKRAHRQSILVTPLSTNIFAADDDHDIEEEVMYYDDYIIDQENEELFEGNRGLCMSIAYYYRCVLRYPSRSKCLGKQGTVKHIRNIF